MTAELNHDDVDTQTEKAVTNVQILDRWKRDITAQLADAGEETEGGAFLLAHTLDGKRRIDDLGEVRTSHGEARRDDA